MAGTNYSRDVEVAAVVEDVGEVEAVVGDDEAAKTIESALSAFQSKTRSWRGITMMSWESQTKRDKSSGTL
jgi:hypothetical protein